MRTPDMDQYQASERDICTKLITPAIQQAGWQQHQFREEAIRRSRAHLDNPCEEHA